MCFEDNFVQIGAPQIQISLNYLNIEILEHERIILGTQKENILPRLPKRFFHKESYIHIILLKLYSNIYVLKILHIIILKIDNYGNTSIVFSVLEATRDLL